MKTKTLTVNSDEIKNTLGIDLDKRILHLLGERDVCTLGDIQQFLYPQLSQLPRPQLLHGMEMSCGIIYEIIQKNGKILVWGDYDVDGTTGTALLVSFLRSIGGDVEYHIPNRLTEGYGVNEKGIQQFAEKYPQHAKLLITVDCGISSHDEVACAKQLGLKVIVTDHHEPPEKGVNADAILNARQPHCQFEEKNLAGVGVAFYLAAGVRATLQECGYFTKKNIEIPNLKDCMDLVALGTVADMVPLTGANRILVKAGFEVLLSRKNYGLTALLKTCGIFGGILTSEDIAFQLAPKINAAGRLGEAKLAVELFLSRDPVRADELAEKLVRINNKRKKIVEQDLETALTITSMQMKKGNVIVVSGDFHHGVIGILASKLVEEYNLPALVLSPIQDEKNTNPHKTVLKGSGRSVEGVNLYEALSECARDMIQFGGHKMAAGLTISQENVVQFKKNMSLAIGRQLLENESKPPRLGEVEFPIEKLLHPDMIEQLLLLEPFGVGNRRPTFHDGQVRANTIRCVGATKAHLKVSFRGKYNNVEGIGFGLGSQYPALVDQEFLQVIYSPMVSRYGSNEKWEVKILDIS